MTILKSLTPLPLRRFIRRSVVLPRVKYAWSRLWLAAYLGKHQQPTLSFATLRNTLPNSGAVPTEQEFASAHEIIKQFPDAAHRKLDIKGFEGFAVDDAVFDPVIEQFELWSYAPLASVIAAFAYQHYEQPSMLELGCGAAHLFYFYRDLGIWNYVGIDGNPLFVKLNPMLSGFEHHFMHLNLQEEIRLFQDDQPIKFDIVCTFEVLEHIREDAVDNLLRTIRSHMHDRSILFCTSSLQDKIDVHILVRDRAWWLNRFARVGLSPHPHEATIVREIASNHPFNWTPEISNVFALEVSK